MPAARSGKSTTRRTSSRAKSARPTRTGGRAAASSRADKSVEAFRDALERSVTISRERLQEVVDESVKRGRMTRRDAEEFMSTLVRRGRKQQNELLRDLEKLVKQARKDLDSRTAEIRKEFEARAKETRKELDARRTRARKATSRARRQATTAGGRAGRAARDIGDQPLKRIDEARRRAGLPPSFPITAYDRLTVPQIKSRLTKLDKADLRKVRTYEKANEARKGILSDLDRRIDGSAKKKPAAKRSTAKSGGATRARRRSS